MSLHRVTLCILASLFTAGISSAASAGCCGNWGVAAPVVYAPVTYAPAAYAWSGCGHCGTPTAAVVYAQPVAPATVLYAEPVAPAPVVYSGWSGCGHCGSHLLSYAPAIEPIAIAPAPIYVVNQGPDYTGPGIMAPYHTWTPSASYVVPGAYPWYRRHYHYWHHYRYRPAYYGPRRRYYR